MHKEPPRRGGSNEYLQWVLLKYEMGIFWRNGAKWAYLGEMGNIVAKWACFIGYLSNYIHNFTLFYFVSSSVLMNFDTDRLDRLDRLF